MPHDEMTQCEQKKKFKHGSEYSERWVVVPAATLDGVASDRIRCMHCQGAVRLHKQRVPDGPQDHVEHRSRNDSEHCKGGSYFLGVHRTEVAPVIETTG